MNNVHTGSQQVEPEDAASGGRVPADEAEPASVCATCNVPQVLASIAARASRRLVVLAACTRSGASAEGDVHPPRCPLGCECTVGRVYAQWGAIRPVRVSRCSRARARRKGTVVVVVVALAGRTMAGMNVTRIMSGYVECEIEVHEGVQNSYKTLHGGVCLFLASLWHVFHERFFMGQSISFHVTHRCNWDVG